MIPTLPTIPNRSQAASNAAYVAQVEEFLEALPAWSAAVEEAGTLYALSVSSTSTTNIAIGASGDAIAMNLGAGKGFMPGMLLNVAVTADATKFMQLRVLTYDIADGSGTQRIFSATGSGTYDAWSVSLAPDPAMLGKQAFWAPARAWIPRTTNGAPLNAVESTTNKVNSRTLDFDASTIEYAQLELLTGKSWNGGTITARPVWSHASTATHFKVSWGLQALALANDDALDTAFGTAIYSNDTGGTTDDIYIGDETAAITASNTPAEGDLLILQCLRKADDATNDTMTIDARLHGWLIYLTFDQGNDA